MSDDPKIRVRIIKRGWADYVIEVLMFDPPIVMTEMAMTRKAAKWRAVRMVRQLNRARNPPQHCIVEEWEA